MADKDSTLIIEVDLACESRCTKIQNVLCKIKEKENIKSISYDTKKNEVTITGSFDPHQLYHKLRCKAGCVIKGYRIPEKKKEEKKEDKVVANTTVNLQFTQVCYICYPSPCTDRNSHCQPRPYEGVMVPTGNHHQRPPTCTGPPICGGDGGWCRPPMPTPICCPGPSCGGCKGCRPPICCPGPSCGGCKGCRVVHQQRYECHEYQSYGCIVM